VFKLKADPTFKAKVDIPVAGGDTKPLTVFFKHRTRSGLKEWIDDPETGAKKDLDFLMDFVVGWENADEEFSRDALDTLIEHHGGASSALRDKYLQELTGQRLGN
jgi:hypothetical protein